MSLNTSSADISLLPPPAALANVEKKLKSTRWLIAIAGTVLVILAGLGGGLLYHFLSSASKSTVPSAGSESSSTSDTHSPSTANQYQVLGCFHDENAHALTISAGTGFNVQTCYEYASLHQYGYFGLENGGDCYVGNGNYAVYGDANVCQSTCSDGSAGPCGGQWLLSVYSVNAVTVQCAGNEFATPAAGTGGRHLICLPCGANSSSQGGQSTACSCNSGYSNWVVGVGCSV